MRKKGFTLIEVLIVVIILGILATLALPQFIKMINRARLAEAWASLGGIRTAEAVYYLENNKYTTTLTQIDFNAPSGSLFTYTISGGTGAWTGVATGLATGKGSGITAWLWTGNSSYSLP